VRREEILKRLDNGHMLIVQDKVDGSTRYTLKAENFRHRIRWPQYEWLRANCSLKIVSERIEHGFRHIEYRKAEM
jgi:hypothetical protein